ncbi:beta-ketoacyl synthase N-terminal-like domain-containing protein [Streptomyces netropsis]
MPADDVDRRLAHDPIAIVGLAGMFPGARDLGEFWDNIVAGRGCTTDVPPAWWNTEDHYDPDLCAPDKAYAHRGGFLSPTVFARTYLDTLPPWTEDSFPGIPGNVVSGRVANRLDLGAANHTVDAACASSLTGPGAAGPQAPDGPGLPLIPGRGLTLGDGGGGRPCRGLADLVRPGDGRVQRLDRRQRTGRTRAPSRPPSPTTFCAPPPVTAGWTNCAPPGCGSPAVARNTDCPRCRYRGQAAAPDTTPPARG